MSAWWNNLTGLEQFFWSVAIAASLFQLFFFASSLFGGGDFDHDADIGGDIGGDLGSGDLDAPAGAGHHGQFDTHEGIDPHRCGHGIKLLSLRGIVAFALGFGWTGALGLGSGWAVGLTLLAAVAFGLVFIVVIYFMMRFLVAMQDPGGCINYHNAVGQRGQAYFTIPGARAGRGQIEVMLQGRLITADAVTEHPDPIPPRAPVTIIAVENATTLVVEPSTIRDHLTTP